MYKLDKENVVFLVGLYNKLLWDLYLIEDYYINKCGNCIIVLIE